MRHKGNKNEYKEQQDREVWLAYRRIFSLYGGKIGVKQLYNLVAFAPSFRFFVSDLQAARVIKNMLNSTRKNPNSTFNTHKFSFDIPHSTLQMRPARYEMYSEIYQRVQLLHSQQPQLSLTQTVEAVLQQPAPKMYLSPRQISAIIKQQRKIRTHRTPYINPTSPYHP